MNNILEEITYSDGRMDDVVKSLYTPAKLKLRARTYEGINKNLSKRRGATTSNTFSIPNAFMAVEVPSGNEGGSGYTVIASDDLKEIKLGDNVKKLKINRGQAEGITNKAIISPTVKEEQHQEVATPEKEVIPVAQEMPETVAEPVVHEAIETTPVEEEVVNEVETPVEPVVSEIPVVTTAQMDPLDAAREKVLNMPNATPVVEEKDVVKKVEETDVFKDLEQATNEYAKADEEFKKSARALEDAQKDLEMSINDYEKIEDNIERTNAKIEERKEAIDSAKKEKEDIENQIKEIEEKTRAKIRLVNAAKEQKLRDKRAKEQETSKVQSENKLYQEKIEESTIKANDLEERNKELEKQENEALAEKRKAQEIYNSQLAVSEAITLPEGISLENEMEEVVSISAPTFIDSEKDCYNDEEQGYTYKKVA